MRHPSSHRYIIRQSCLHVCSPAISQCAQKRLSADVIASTYQKRPAFVLLYTTHIHTVCCVLTQERQSTLDCTVATKASVQNCFHDRYICIYIYIYIYIMSQQQAKVCMYAYLCVCVCVHYAHKCTHIPACILMFFFQTLTHTHACTCILTRQSRHNNAVNTYTHTYMHMHTNTPVSAQ